MTTSFLFIFVYCIAIQVMYISCPIALSSMIAVLVYSHVTIPSSYNSLVHLYGTTRQSEDDVASHKSLLETVDILSSELASPLVSGTEAYWF